MLEIGQTVSFYETATVQSQGTVTAIGDVPPSGDYRIITILSGGETFTRPEDEIQYQLAVTVYINPYATESPSEAAQDIYDEARKMTWLNPEDYDWALEPQER